MSTDYELCKKYLIRNVEVTSEVVKDEESEVNGRQWRALVIRSSCDSSRWGVRSQDHSYSYQVPFEDFASSFEATRVQAAEVLVATELGEISEEGIPLILVEIIGPTGERRTPGCGVNLGVSPTLLSPEFIALLRLEPSGDFYCEVVNGSPRLIPLYAGRIRFGAYDVQTRFLPATYNGPVVLGGDFFQKALQGKEDIIGELIMPDHFRTLMNAARCKKKYVLVLGKYGDQRDRLHRIKQTLADKMLIGLILDEYPDIEEQSLTEKMVTYATISRFVLADDVAPSGHIKELEICHDLKFVTAVLRPKGKPATAMQADIGDEVSFIRDFSYDDEGGFEKVISDAIDWANHAVGERANNLNRKYSDWRSPGKLMG